MLYLVAQVLRVNYSHTDYLNFDAGMPARILPTRELSEMSGRKMCEQPRNI